MTESLEANLWYSQSVLSFIWWNSPARLWKCEHQLQKIQWQLLGGNVSGSQHLDSMIQLESKHVKMIGNMSNIVIQQILVSCFFDLYVFMYYVKNRRSFFNYFFYLRLPFSRGHASMNQCIKWQVCAIDCLSARCERIFRAPWKQEMNQ